MASNGAGRRARRGEESGGLCAVCCLPRATRSYHLTHGIVIELCRIHRADEFLRRREGRAFTDRLRSVWAANGVLTTRRAAALRTHRLRIRPAPADRRRPGSYAWPELRRHAEARFAAGEAPGTLIAELRRRHAHDAAQAPTVRTMRRWFAEARWLHAPKVPAAPGRPAQPPERPNAWMLEICGLPRHPFGPYTSWAPDQLLNRRRH